MIGPVHIMGILNLTPDSFYAGSRVRADALARRYFQMREEGADIVDIGACSTRPGAKPVSEKEEWRRLEPALKALPEGCRISVDTYRSEIVRRAFETAGPVMINDISGGRFDERMLETVADLHLPYVAMHLKGTAETMHDSRVDGDIVAEVNAFFRDFSRRADAAGIETWLLDPGFGFSKTIEQNWELLRRLDELDTLGHPLLAGLSRKSMLYKTTGIAPEEAMPATQVVQFAALERGARWLRVHDVARAVETARLYSTMYMSSPGAAK